MTTSVELQNTQAFVAPFEGAITKVVFETDKGTPLLITIKEIMDLFHLVVSL